MEELRSVGFRVLHEVEVVLSAGRSIVITPSCQGVANRQIEGLYDPNHGIMYEVRSELKEKMRILNQGELIGELGGEEAFAGLIRAMEKESSRNQKNKQSLIAGTNGNGL